MTARRIQKKDNSRAVKVTDGKSVGNAPAILNTGQITGQINKIESLTESNRQLKRKIFDLYTIFEISRDFNAVLDFHTLLDTFILTSLAQVGASRGAIYLEGENDIEGYVLVKKRGSGSFPAKDKYFASDSRLAGHLASLNRPVVTAEVIDEIADQEEHELLKKYHPGLLVPLMYQAHLSGMLILTDKVSDRDFTMDDIEFLSILGNQISVAIENSRLYEAEKKASEQLRAAQQQLINSERLAALGEMSAKVAHEVNNPLGIIKNYVLLLKRESEGNPEAVGYSDIVKQEIDRIARIVRELLDFHRPQRDNLEKVSLATVLNATLMLLERQLANDNIVLIRDFEKNLPEIVAAPENLKQVFMNIVINGCDIMPKGGTLKVSLAQVDDQLEIKFCDTGPGISEEVASRIFEPFFTTKESGKGTGLGLSVCYGIIRQHGGTISYNNTETGGCFQINLPLVRKMVDHD